jgi:C-terminal processing protease CtpA/Prc
LATLAPEPASSEEEPMQPVSRHLGVTALVCASALALVAGVVTRQEVESNSAGLRSASLLAPGLIASRDAKADIPEERYFYDLILLLKREFVDPVEDEMTLAIGSVKGMVGGLNDVRSIFMSEPLFQAFVGSIQGDFEGIGARIALKRPNGGEAAPARTYADLLARVPVARVTYVAPGGPADRAGMRPGDEVESIEGRWVVNPRMAARLKDIASKVQAKKLPQQAYLDIQDELRGKLKNSMMPMRALERLMVGQTGTIELEWRRGGQILKAILEKEAYRVPVNVVADGSFRLAFIDGAPKALSAAASAEGPLTLDLRGVEQGDYRTMLDCLGALGPAGTYGRIVKDSGSAEPLKIGTGVEPGKPVTIRVDRFTGGVAEAFALALQAKGLAKLEGGPMAGDPSIVERTALPDGSGFTLRTGKFVAGDEK